MAHDAPPTAESYRRAVQAGYLIQAVALYTSVVVVWVVITGVRAPRQAGPATPLLPNYSKSKIGDRLIQHGVDLLATLRPGAWVPATVGLLATVVLGAFAWKVRSRWSLMEHEAFREIVVDTGRDLVKKLLVIAAFALGLLAWPGGSGYRYFPLLFAALCVVMSDRVFFRHEKGSPPTIAGERPPWRARVRRGVRQDLKHADILGGTAPFFTGSVTVTSKTGEQVEVTYESLIEKYEHRLPLVAAYVAAMAVETRLFFAELAGAERIVDQWIIPGRVPWTVSCELMQEEFFRYIGGPGRAVPDNVAARARSRFFTKRGRLRAARCFAGPAQIRAVSLVAAHWVQTGVADGTLRSRTALIPVLELYAALLADPRNDIRDVYWTQLLQARTTAVLGDLMVTQHKPTLAASDYMDAALTLTNIRDYFGGADSLVNAQLNLLQWTLIPEVDGMRNVVDKMRIGLETLEHVRLQLHSSRYRTTITSAYEGVHRRAMDICYHLAPHYQANDPAMLALWISEALKRSAIADIATDSGRAVASQVREAVVGGSATEGTAKWQIADAFSSALRAAPIDLKSIVSRLNGTAALSYNVWASDTHWVMRAVLVEDDAVELFGAETELPKPSDGGFSTAGALLSALAKDDPASFDLAMNGLAINERGWVDVAHFLLPIKLAARLADRGRPVPLVIAADWPLSRVPFPALNVDGDRLLVDVCDPVFVPSLSALGPAQQRPIRTVLAHLDGDRVEVSGELDALNATDSTMRVDYAASAANLVDRLSTETDADLLYVSAHGEYVADAWQGALQVDRDVSITASNALLLHFPRTVVLGSCCLGEVRPEHGTEPTGFSVACLMRGARTVVGNIAPVDDETISSIFAELARTVAATNQFEAADLWRAVRTALRDHPELRDAPPVNWSVLVCWTLDTPLTPAATNAARPSFEAPWELNGLRAGGSEPRLRLSDLASDLAELIAALTIIIQRSLSTNLDAGLQQLEDKGSIVTTKSLLTMCTEHGGVSAPTRWSALELALDYRHRTATTNSNELEGALFSVEFSTNHRVVLTTEATAALVTACGLRRKLRHEYLTAAHLAYGGLSRPDGDAAMVCTTPEITVGQLAAIAGDKLFSGHVPTPVECFASAVEQMRVPDKQRQPTPDQDSLSVAYGLGSDSWPRPKVALIALVALFAGGTMSTYLARPRFPEIGYAYIGVGLGAKQQSNGRVLVVIDRVFLPSPADDAGLKPGDVIVAINGTQPATVGQATNDIRSLKVGDIAHLTVERSEAKISVSVVLA